MKQILFSNKMEDMDHMGLHNIQVHTVHNKDLHRVHMDHKVHKVMVHMDYKDHLEHMNQLEVHNLDHMELYHMDHNVHQMVHCMEYILDQDIPLLHGTCNQVAYHHNNQYKAQHFHNNEVDTHSLVYHKFYLCISMTFLLDNNLPMVACNMQVVPNLTQNGWRMKKKVLIS